MQISFLQFLKTIRMVKAIELILKTQKPIGDVAFEVGYTSISSFSDAFQEFTHSRPTHIPDLQTSGKTKLLQAETLLSS
jgi:transcriptional regulator GlxA family with amidase domain